MRWFSCHSKSFEFWPGGWWISLDNDTGLSFSFFHVVMIVADVLSAESIDIRFSSQLRTSIT